MHNHGRLSRVDFKSKVTKKAACIRVPQLPFLGDLNQQITNAHSKAGSDIFDFGEICSTLA